PGGGFRGWLRTIARSKLADFFRQRVKSPPGIGGFLFQEIMNNLAAEREATDAGSGGLPPLEHLLTLRRFLEVVRAEVEERTWQAFWRTAVDAEPTAGVALDLAMTPTAVRIAKSRVLRKLRLLLADE